MDKDAPFVQNNFKEISFILFFKEKKKKYIPINI